MSQSDPEDAQEKFNRAHARFLESHLRYKKGDKPCHRCGHNHFYVPSDNQGPFFVTYCSNCGFKNEYLVSILIDLESGK